MASTKWPWKFSRPFFYQTQNGNGNFHASFWQAQNGHGNFHGHFFFYKRKMAMEISMAILFLQTQNGHGNFQGQCLQRRGGGGEGQNDNGHFCVFSTKLEILLKIQRILSIRYLDFRLGVSWSVVDRGFVYSFERIINNCTLPVIYFGSWISSLLILTGLIYRIVDPKVIDISTIIVPEILAREDPAQLITTCQRVPS